MNSKGLSTVVTTLLIIMLVIVLGGIIFGVIKGVATDKLTDAEACYDLFDTITLNDDYICYEESTQRMVLSLNRQVIDLDSLTISITMDGSSKIVSLTDTFTNVPDVGNYPLGGNEEVNLPGNEEGKSYWINGITSKPTKVEIAPVRMGNNCGVIDEITTIVNCA